MATAIICKYFGPTNHRGSRIRVSAHGHKARFLGYSYESRANDGINIADVIDYVCDCFPFTSFDKLNGPFTIDEDTSCFTIKHAGG